MKKIVRILIVYTFFCFLLCLLYGFFVGKIPDLISGYVKQYRLFSGLRLFCKIAPAILFTGFIIGCAISFGRNPEGSTTRFSSAMFHRYRGVLVSGLVCVFILSVVSEIGTPLLGERQKQMEQMPNMVNDYVRIGNDLFDRNKLTLATHYAQFALDLDPAAENARKLMQRIDLKKDETYAIGSSDETKDEPSSLQLSEDGETVLDFRNKAESAAAEGDWFGAHYFAEAGLSIASPRDINIDMLKDIAARAWNVLSAPRSDQMTEGQKVFAQKMEGYRALMDNDNLHAYYLFRSLSLQSHELSIDRDVVRYLAIAEHRLNNECFFIDEKSFIRGFESASNVHFAMNVNGGTDIIYIKGITTVFDSGDTVQYLRGFSMFHLDAEGNYVRGLFVPYAKMLEISTSDLDNTTKRILFIPDTAKNVPYILLRSIDRNEQGSAMKPVYYYAGKTETEGPDHLFLPIAYEDFLMITESAKGAEYMRVKTLFQFISKAGTYGYSEEVFAQVLIERLFYPLLMLILLVLFASYAWNNRIGEYQIFKFKWIFAFPIFSVLFYYVHLICLWLFKLLNYTLLGIMGISSALICCLFIYIIMLVIASLVFLSRNASEANED